MIGRFLRHPLPYLVLLIGVAYWNAEDSGWLRPKITNDTVSYEHLLDATTVSEALSGLRSYGYPLVLRTFGLEHDGWAAVPRFHFVLYSLSILVFWLGVARFTRSRWVAFGAAAPLCFASAGEHVRLVVTDSIAESLGVAVVALLLLLVAGRAGWARVLTATLLGMAVFMTYWIRPIYQFLVVLVPLLGAVLCLCHAPRRRCAVGRWTAGLAALTLVPLLVLSVVRWNAVGEFGVSSLTGYHIGSIGALMLDEELVDEMPEGTQRLAREILAGRERLGLRPMRLRSRSSHYQARQFGLTMFEIAEPIVRDLVLEERGRTLREDRSTDLGPLDIPGIMGPTALEMDSRLGRLGRAAIRARPLIYAKWVADAIRLGVLKVYRDRWLNILLSLLVLSIPLLLVRASRDATLFQRDGSDRVLGLLGLTLVAGFYFLGHTVMIALVHWPKDRYAVAANLLLPAVAGAGLVELWRWILPPGDGLRRRSGVKARIVSTGFVLVLCILMAETFFRIVDFDFDRQERHRVRIPIFYREPSVPTGPGFFHRAGPATWNGPVLRGGDDVEVRYDGDGFRNPPDLEDWEIVVVGDGFVESGYLQYDKIFTSRLGRRSGLRVKNLGVGSTGTLTHIHYLETWGRSVSTRHAVLVFNEGNDLKDLPREAGRLFSFQESGRRENRSIIAQSSLLRAIYRSLARLVGDVPRERAVSVPPDANADLVLPGQSEARRVRIFQRIPGRRHLPASRVEQLDEVMRRWAESARALGLEPWLLYIPCKHRILFPYLRYDADVPEPIRIWKPTDLPGLVRSLADAHGIGFLDPGPRLARATANGKLVYNPIDVHLSEVGSRQVGRFLATQLGEARSPRAAPEKIATSEAGGS